MHTRFFLLGAIVATVTVGLGATPPQRTLLLEVRDIPASEQNAPGRFVYDGYDLSRILNLVRNTAHVLATPTELEELRQAGFSPKMLMESNDLMTLIRRGNYGPDLKLDPVYHTYEQILRRAEELAREYPQLITRLQLGETTQLHRPIYAYRLSNRAADVQERPGVLFNGGHHSAELMGPEIVLALMEKLLAGYGVVPEVTGWLDTLEIYLVPVINVDGHNIVTSGRDPRWQKNARDVNSDGTIGFYREGVNVNRNYDFNWTMGGSGEPAVNGYRGEYPFSEAENRAMRTLALRKQFLLSVSYHSSGEVIFYPWSWNGRPAPDDALLKGIAAAVAGEIRTMDGKSTYAIAPGGAASQSYAWFYGRLGVFDLIVETGAGAYIFPPEDVPGIITANLPGAYELLRQAAGPGLKVQVTDAATGKPLVAEVWLPQIEDESVDRRTTDAHFGRRWRLLVPGKHNVIISRDGYQTEVCRDVEVDAKNWTPLEISLKPAAGSGFENSIKIR